MKKQTLKNVISFIICLALALSIPYIVQFKLNMFGANFITFKDIVGLWFGSLLIFGMIWILYIIGYFK